MREVRGFFTEDGGVLLGGVAGGVSGLEVGFGLERVRKGLTGLMES